MREYTVRCLLFAGGKADEGETLPALLRERSFSVTRSVEPQECLDLLGGSCWRFLILDASGDVHGSLGVLSRAREACPDVPVLVLVRQGDMETAVRAMKAGAIDCMETPVEPVCLLAAIAPLCGQTDRESEELWLSLTSVERIVLWHVLDGRTNRQIADLLCRSTRTIEVHRRHIMTKLGADNLIDLVRQAMRAGMLNCPASQAARARHVVRKRTPDFGQARAGDAAGCRSRSRRAETA